MTANQLPRQDGQMIRGYFADKVRPRVSPELISRSKQAAWDIYVVRQITDPLGDARARYLADMACIDALAKGGDRG